VHKYALERVWKLQLQKLHCLRKLHQLRKLHRLRKLQVQRLEPHVHPRGRSPKNVMAVNYLREGIAILTKREHNKWEYWPLPWQLNRTMTTTNTMTMTKIQDQNSEYSQSAVNDFSWCWDSQLKAFQCSCQWCMVNSSVLYPFILRVNTLHP